MERALRRVSLVILLVGCAPPAPPEPPSAVVAPAPPATETAAPTPPPAAPRGRRFVVASRPLAQDLDDDLGPAPCDFNRSYRGVVGKTHLTLLLKADATDKLSGLVHYDKPGPAIAVSGSRRGSDDITLQEKGGGRFEGRCDGSGKLRGTFTIGKRSESFTLDPRPPEWPALYRVEVSFFAEPHHPRCATEAKPIAAVELDTNEGKVICLPTDPKIKRQLIADSPYLLCSASDRGYRVFGLPDPKVEKAVNERLSPAWMEIEKKSLERCTSLERLSRSTSLVAARRDLLVVSSFRSNDYGGAHPMNFGGGAEVIDLVRGSSVSLDEIVDPARLRDAALACFHFFAVTRTDKPDLVIDGPLPPAGCGNEPGYGRYTWGCAKDDRETPEWALLPEGIVIGGWAMPHAMAADEGKGPLLPWSVLLREKALRPSSPLARLWAGVAAAPADMPACPMTYEGDRLLVWSEAPRSP
jgi:hypothetical protein